MLKRESLGSSAKIACTALLSGIMALSMPMTAMAQEYDISTGSITVSAESDGKQYVTQANNAQADHAEQTEPTVITGSSDSNTVTITSAENQTANVTFSNLNIDVSGSPYIAAVTVGGNGGNAGAVTIELDGTNTLQSGTTAAGLQDELVGTLTIQDENNSGQGVLNTTGGNNGAGIGGGHDGAGSNITITGGTIVATGGLGGGAGIGGGSYGVGSNITISGGDVTARAHHHGAGIGGGEDRTGFDITISGGTVNARGGNNGAGIGGGSSRAGSNITISGGSVTATGGSKGAGIGGGGGSGYGLNDATYGSVSNITISGGTVTAIGTDSGAGIGAGRGKTSTGITISGAANVSAAGGHSSGTYGAGAAIGGGGATGNEPGEESDVNTSGLYTTGSVRKFNAGTQADQMNDEGNLQTDTEGNPAIIQGTVTPPASVTPMSLVSSDSNVESSGSGDYNDNGSPSQPTVNGYAVFLSTLNTQISNNLKQVNALIASGNPEAAKAKYPDGYTINTGNWISFKRDTYELLDKLIQAGVPVIINFTYKGKSYSVTIPAGSAVSLVSLCNKEGYCGFMNLYRVFGGTVK